MNAKNNVKIASSPSTHKCLQNALTSAQIMGIFPVANLRDDNPGKLRFKLKSWRVVHTFLFSSAYLTCASLSFYKALTQGILLNQLISPLFYFHAFTTSVVFARMAAQWPQFILQWSRVEDHFLKKYKPTPNLHRKVNIGVVLMILIAFLEHSLAITNAIYSINCQNNSTGWEHHFRKQSHFIFRYIPYSFSVGLGMMVVSWIASFVWNFGDIFIILVSVIMTARFKQITQRIRKYCEELNGRSDGSKEILDSFVKVYGRDYMKAEFSFWRDVREDYDKMCQTIRSLDRILSNLVLLSYAFNLTFILIQLFNSLRQMQTAVEGVYFFYSFGFVISRIVVVSIFGASVNEESQASLHFLHSIPTEVYNEEIERLITQVHVDSAALTGHNFFRITKGLVLSVAAAIITYELVLIQFNQTTLDKYMDTNGTICY